MYISPEYINHNSLENEDRKKSLKHGEKKTEAENFEINDAF